MTERTEAIVTAVQPALAALGLELFDLELVGTGRARLLRVFVDRDGGVDLDAITAATEAIGPLLDRGPAAVALDGPYSLEISSPGLERTLRTPAHFARARGSFVSIKTRDAQGHGRRERGTLLDADESGVTVEIADEPQRFAYDEIVQARTVFEWGAPGARAAMKGEGS